LSGPEPDVKQALLERLFEFLEGKLSPPQLEHWLIESRTLLRLFGKEGYAHVAKLEGADQERAIWRRLRRLLDLGSVETLAQELIREACEGILTGSRDLPEAVRAVRILQFMGGLTLTVCREWDRLAGHTADIPSAEQYGYWAAEPLQEKLVKLEMYRPRILRAARRTLQALG
jgi:hypothetical protein